MSTKYEFASGHVTSEKVVGRHCVRGRTVDVVRLTWDNSAGLSYDVVDAVTDEVLTINESFDEYPTEEQIATVLSQ